MNDTEKNLVEMVLSLSDLDEATSALTELKYINPKKAGKIALDILNEKKGDAHLQASAFEVLYSVEQSLAFQFIEENLNSTELLVFRSMLECVTEDSSLVVENTKLDEIVRALKGKVDNLNVEENNKIGEALDWFKESFKEL